jgi:phosphoglycolate phosphatase-like HAD superfamily hydrolase
MMASFEEHYYANHHHYLTAYDGIVELLEELKARGARCAVLSLASPRGNSGLTSLGCEP